MTRARILVSFTPKSTIGPDRHQVDLQEGSVVEYFRNNASVVVRWGHDNVVLASEEIPNLEFLD